MLKNYFYSCSKKQNNISKKPWAFKTGKKANLSKEKKGCEQQFPQKKKEKKQV